MAGAMNKNCFPFRPLLTEHLLLGTPLPEELSRHVDACPDCTREASETDAVVRTLQRVNPLADCVQPRASDLPPRPSRDLGDRIRRDMAGVKTARTGHGRRIMLGLAASFVTATAVLIPLNMPDRGKAPGTAVVLVRQGQMVDQAWGTEVPVAVSGMEAGETYRMMTVNADGTRLSGGTIRADSGGQVSSHMMTAMDKDTITALIVEDDEGRVVSHVLVRPSPA
ncbi:hypothetical protein RJT17_36500 [Streptomyces sp. P5-A9]|uniref:hypothetical protein n=1 Tax=Streptomyces sp. P5-A9 TaxID=3071730 RepID=UPI002FC5EA6D